MPTWNNTLSTESQLGENFTWDGVTDVCESPYAESSAEWNTRKLGNGIPVMLSQRRIIKYSGIQGQFALTITLTILSTMQ